MVPDANDTEAVILELDELWSFVLKKTNQAWIWIALCRKTRQVVAYASREIEAARPAANGGKLPSSKLVWDTVTLIFGVRIRR